MEEVVRCVCGVCKNDELPMVACDTCLVWQHMECTGYKEELTDKYLCEKCQPSEHTYLLFGFKTHKDYLKGKKEAKQADQELAATNGRRRSSFRSVPYGESESAYEPPQTRPANLKKPSFKQSEANGASVKVPKRRISVSSFSEEDKGNKLNNGTSLNSSTTLKYSRNGPAKKKQKHGSGSDKEITSENDASNEVNSDAQLEVKTPSSTIEAQGAEAGPEERDKETKKSKPKRTNSKSSSLTAENMTLDQMLDRVRRMAQYVTRIEIEHAKKNGLDEDEYRLSSSKITPKKSRTTSLALMITPSPSDHVASPESFAGSPMGCDGITTPPTSDLSEKEATLIDLCEELMRDINRFEQQYGERQTMAVSKKFIKI